MYFNLSLGTRISLIVINQSDFVSQQQMIQGFFSFFFFLLVAIFAPHNRKIMQKNTIRLICFKPFWVILKLNHILDCQNIFFLSENNNSFFIYKLYYLIHSWNRFMPFMYLPIQNPNGIWTRLSFLILSYYLLYDIHTHSDTTRKLVIYSLSLQTTISSYIAFKLNIRDY